LFANKFETLPGYDPSTLVDRKEYWLLHDNPFDDNIEELDEYCIAFDRTSGEILLRRNNDRQCQPRILTFADPNQVFYPFFFLNGRITALSVFASNIQIMSTNPNLFLSYQTNPAISENINDAHGNDGNHDDDDDTDQCTICFDAKATCVLLPCGHMIFCRICKDKHENQLDKCCPKCRTEFQQIIEIAED
jgi:hypothetical protein